MSFETRGYNPSQAVTFGYSCSNAIQTLDGQFISFDAPGTGFSSATFDILKSFTICKLNRIRSTIDNANQASANDLTLSLNTATATSTSHTIVLLNGLSNVVYTTTTVLGNEIPAASELAWLVTNTTDAAAVTIRGFSNTAEGDPF